MYPSTFLSIYQYMYLSIYIFSISPLHLFFYLSIYPSIHLSIYLSVTQDVLTTSFVYNYRFNIHRKLISYILSMYLSNKIYIFNYISICLAFLIKQFSPCSIFNLRIPRSIQWKIHIIPVYQTTLSFYLYTNLCNYLSIYPSIYILIYISIYLAIHLSIY